MDYDWNFRLVLLVCIPGVPSVGMEQDYHHIVLPLVFCFNNLFSESMDVVAVDRVLARFCAHGYRSGGDESQG